MDKSIRFDIDHKHLQACAVPAGQAEPLDAELADKEEPVSASAKTLLAKQEIWHW